MRKRTAFLSIRSITAVLSLLCAAAGVRAQGPDIDTPIYPRGGLIPYSLDTGVHGNPDAHAKIVYAGLVEPEDEASWLRLHFSEAVLEGASAVRVTSMLDGESQQLDAAGLRMWSNSTAYFNGGRVLVELIAAPGTHNNRLKIDLIEAEFAPPEGGTGQCGICGEDDRVPSNEFWAGRLMPVGCTASVYNTCSCLVTAGHCSDGGNVIQFNVPPSLSNCDMVHPPVADQFPITGSVFQSAGVGGDWAVKTTGLNNLGQTIYQRYGQFRPIATSMPAVGAPISIWGYGKDTTCVLNQTQQLSAGSVTGVMTLSVQFDADVRGGNSGSAVIRNGEIVAVVTHCQIGCPNLGTRVDRPDFAAARASLCPCVVSECPADIAPPLGVVNTQDMLAVIYAWGACPAPCPPHCNADINDNCTVNVQDLLAVTNAWGTCP